MPFHMPLESPILGSTWHSLALITKNFFHATYPTAKSKADQYPLVNEAHTKNKGKEK